MLKLFAVVLGGRATGCNTELHDIVFAVGESLENTYPQLIKKWFGNKYRLHIDSTIELKYVDGHEVIINKEKPKEDKKLFFLNFGAYKPDFFGETHEVGFYVGSSKTEALAKAKKELCLQLIEPHCDDNVVVDDIISIDKVDGYHIHLIPTTQSCKLNIESSYQRLDKVKCES